MFNFSLGQPAATLVTFGLLATPIVLIISFVFGHTNAERTRRTMFFLRLCECEWPKPIEFKI